jgi:transcriptional regulator with GAF, ATPase, and Fis domain
MEKDAILTTILKEIIEGKDLLGISIGLFNNLKESLPLNRLGVAITSDDGHFFLSKINISDSGIQLKEGYRAPVHNSSLLKVIRSGQPRIIPSLKEYLKIKPGSVSTRLIVKEGMQSSMTVPLIANNKTIGILFFSSRQEGAFNQEHVKLVTQFSHILSISLEKALLIEKLEKTQYSLDIAMTQNEGLSEELSQLSESGSQKGLLPNYTWAEWQQKIIAQTLSVTKGRIYGEKGAAKLLDLPPTTLQSKMKKLGVSKHTDI